MDNRSLKTCKVCGRQIEWRKKWRKTWKQVKYCSNACRKAGLTDLDQRLESAILGLLRSRSSAKTICPSEAAVKVAGTTSEAVWKPLMPAARNAARRLLVKGYVDILQKGRPVEASTAKGPIRIRLRKDA